MRSPLVLLLAVLATGCTPRPSASIRIDPALETLVPSDTLVLTGIRVEALRATPAYKKWGARALAQVLPSDTGMDLTKVWEILAASNGRWTTVLTRGDFAPQGLEPRLNLPGATRTQYKGYSVTTSGDTAVAFMNASTAVIGRPEAVRAIIDQRGKTNGPRRDLREEIEQIPPGNQVWAAGSGPFAFVRPAPGRGNLANLSGAFNRIKRFRAAADFRNGLKFDATALCNSERDAEDLTGAIHAFVVFAGMNANEPMKRALQSVNIDQQQSTLRVNAMIDEAVLDKVAANLLGR